MKGGGGGVSLSSQCHAVTYSHFMHIGYWRHYMYRNETWEYLLPSTSSITMNLGQTAGL